MSNAIKHDKNLAIKSTVNDELVEYRDAKDEVFLIKGSDSLSEYGFYRFTNSEREKIKDINAGVEDLSRHSSGIQIRFITDSTKIFVKGENQAVFYLVNNTPIGCTGMSLYVYDERLKEYVLHDVLRVPMDMKTYDTDLCHFKEKKLRKYILYLPLYIGVNVLEIGLLKGSIIKHNPFSDDRRVLIYGTSITQGCSASHPGMSYPNIISRELDCEVINFGFSGSAFLEKEMAQIINTRKKDVLVLDTEANSNYEKRIKKNLIQFLETIFKDDKNTKVIIASRILFAMDNYDDEEVKNRKEIKRFQVRTINEYKNRGYNISFIDGSKMIKGNYSEYTADGIHPDDHGMIMIAKAFIKRIKEIM